jgi:hypothetical protein
METAAFLGMLGLGYAFSEKKQTKEGFEVQYEPVTNTPNNYSSIVPGVAVKQPPLKYEAPLGVRRTAAKDLDLMYNFPASSRIDSEPNPDKQGGYLGFPVPSASSVPQRPSDAVISNVRQNTSGQEKTPVLTKEKTIISPLTGLAMKPEEFTHANMVPFYRGNLKQNMSDTANRTLLDNYTGGGVIQQEKREQGPMFEASRAPTGVPYGSEIATDYMQERVVAPTNRASERPFEQVRVGKGLGQGFTSLPSGGYQQADALHYARPRSTDELRTANNPKLTYEGRVVKGAHFVTAPGKLGEVRKHLPDKFYLNKNGERNFTTTGANLKATERPVQVLRETTRPETTKEYEGPAKSQDFNATYTVASTRAPMVKQAGSWGFRNADSTSYADKDTEKDQNDYGKAGIEIRPNERYFTGERGQTLNPKPQGTGKVTMPLQDGPRQTRKDENLGNPNQAGYFNTGNTRGPAYDPNDVARTTIKETTLDGDYMGTASGPLKLTTYDPDDIAKTTIRETTEDSDYVGAVAGPAKLTVYDPDETARTTIRETTEDSDYVGGVAGPVKLAVYDPDDVAKTTIRETTEDDDYVGVASGPVKLTVYDPDDVARTTIKETTEDNGYVGIASPNMPTQLTIYDPEDVAKTTIRNTTDNFDYTRNLKRADNPEEGYVPYSDIARVTDREALSATSEYFGNADSEVPKEMVTPFPDGARKTQKASISAKSAYTGSGYSEDKKALVNPYLDGARQTQKAAISAKSSYTGAAGTANAKAPRSSAAEQAMRQYPQKENIAKGRAPAGNIAVFNGEDYVNLKYNKIESDYINDRSPVVSRVLNDPPSEAQLGLMRPRAVLKLDVGMERNAPEVVEALETNPYVIPLRPTAAKASAGELAYINGSAHVKAGMDTRFVEGGPVIDRAAVKKYSS